MKYELRGPQPSENSDHLHEILRARGVEDVDGYLNPKKEFLLNPFLLENMEDGIKLLFNSLEKGEKIFIQQDSDQDGVCSTQVLYNYIRKIKPDANIEVRLHTGKQHGIIVDTVSDDAGLIIIPDQGSNQQSEFTTLIHRGYKILCIDHHHQDEDLSIPGVIAVINNQLSPKYPNKDLSGAGVVYKFLQAFDRTYKYNYANDDLDLVAVAIVSDMMDLRDLETRAIIDYGLNMVKNPGLLSLMRLNAYMMGQKSGLAPIDVSFSIAPYINAITRVGSLEEKELNLMAFTNGNIELPSTKRGAKPGDIETQADQFARVATNVKARQKRLIDQAMEILEGRIEKHALNDNKVLVVFTKDQDNFNTNITGLIAMKLVAKYQKPAILVKENGEGFYRGSLRGLNDSGLGDFRGYLEETDFVEWARGHQNQAGVSIEASQVDKLVAQMNEDFADLNFGDTTFQVDYIYDSGNSALPHTIMELGSADFWGRGVEIPLIAVKNLRVSQKDVAIMKNNTMKITVDGVSYITFRNQKACEDFTSIDMMNVEIVGEPSVNEWAGRRTPQIKIKDYNLKKAPLLEW